MEKPSTQEANSFSRKTDKRAKLFSSLSNQDDHTFGLSGSALSPSLQINAVVGDFISHTTDAVLKESFVSFTLRGPATPKKDKNTGKKEVLRGCIKQVQGRIIALNNKKHTKQATKFMQITIKYHGATDMAKNWRVDNDEIKEGLFSLLLPSSSHDNVALSEWGERGLNPVGSERGIQRGELVAADGIWEMDLKRKKPKLWKWRGKSDKTPNSGTFPASHDRTKQVPLASDAPFLQALGLSKADGKPRAGMSSKLRQCQKFVEIVGGLVESSLANQKDVNDISVVDMGCGRGYLTFSLHSFLEKIHGPMVRCRGIDMRPKLINEITDIARSLGPEFAELQFEEGTIEGVLSGETVKPDERSLKVLIALHACDTATDDALWTGIRGKVNVIVVAPCCHKEVRRQLDSHVVKTGKNHPFADILRHNIYRERAAETATDSIRALLLEIANYNVQVFEFIGGEHTSKNVMITATKRRKPRTSQETMDLKDRLSSLCALHGVREQRLASWTGEKISDDEHVASNRLSSRSMPPL